MTSVEQRKMVQKLKQVTMKMNSEEHRSFEMMAKRDHDDEELDLLSLVKLKQLYGKLFPKHTRNEIQERWNNLTGSKET